MQLGKAACFLFILTMLFRLAMNKMNNIEIENISSLLKACEQSRIYCDLARSMDNGEKINNALREMSDERRAIIMELSRYMRAHGQDPGEDFSHIFSHLVFPFEPLNEEDDDTGILSNLYFSERIVIKMLSELLRHENPSLKKLLEPHFEQTKKISEMLRKRKDNSRTETA